MSELIVADAGPLIGMAQVGLLPLLKDLYSLVLIPPKVHDELQIPLFRPGYEALAVALAEAWMAVALAEQRHVDLLIDEKRGRTVALSRGLQIVGTGAILLLAKERGLIDRVGDALDQLASHSYRIAPSLRARILQKAGEA